MDKQLLSKQELGFIWMASLLKGICGLTNLQVHDYFPIPNTASKRSAISFINQQTLLGLQENCMSVLVIQLLPIRGLQPHFLKIMYDKRSIAVINAARF